MRYRSSTNSAVMGTRPKVVLMVAFHYPPDHSSSGYLRTLKFSKYLPESGWQPVVLTVREQYYQSQDAAQIPSQVVVHRTRAINTKKSLAVGGKYLQLLATPDRYIVSRPLDRAGNHAESAQPTIPPRLEVGTRSAPKSG